MRIKHWRKGLVIGVAAAALMATAAGAVNAATDGALVDYITFTFKGEVTGKEVNPDGSTSYRYQSEDGGDVTVTLPKDAGQNAYQFEQQGNGSVDIHDQGDVSAAKAGSAEASQNTTKK